MCVVIFRIIKVGEQYKLFLASNRDEYVDRPTRQLQMFDGQIAGRDESRGGSWLSFSCSGARFAFLTNVRVPLKDLSNETSTRGALVTNFVSNVSLSCDEYLQQLEAHRSQYAGYNIVFGDLATGVCYWFTNHVKAPLQRGSDASTLVAAGAPADVASAAPPLAFEARHALVAANTTYVVSNEASLNSQWPKVVKAKRLFDELLTEANKNNIFNIAADDTASSSSSSPAAPMPSNTGSGTGLDELDEQRLFARMFDILLADVERIEDLARLPYTGVPDDFEVYLSSIRVPFLPSLRYGTVSSCVAYVDAHGPLRITERSFRQSPTTPITFRAARHICSNAVGASSWPPMSTAASSSTSSTSTPATTTAAAAMPPFHYSDALKAAAISPSTSRKATKRLIFVGDVHACARELNVLLHAIAASPQHDHVVLLGDLIGKGPFGHEVVEFARLNRSFVSSILGNWDYHGLRVWRGIVKFEDASSAVKSAIDGLDDEDMRYLDTLPYQLYFPEYGMMAVHAGVRWSTTTTKDKDKDTSHQHAPLPFEQIEPNDLLNMRCVRPDGSASKKGAADADDPQLLPWASLYQGPYHVLFGHDATRRLQCFPFATGLDTGCCFGGQLSALIMPHRLICQVDAFETYKEIGKEKL